MKREKQGMGAPPPQPAGETPLLALERREEIIRLLQAKSKILVPELCQRFGVSPATVRADLRSLAGEGRLRRAHGGAIPTEKAGFEPNSRSKAVERVAEKRRIARRAAEMIEDGDIIILDSGTTTLELAKLLAGRSGLTVVTNDLAIASVLEEASGLNLVLIGGEVRRGFHCTVGPMAVEGMVRLNVDKAFLASNAFSWQGGFTTPNLEHAEVKRAMVSAASERIMLMDSSKYGKRAFVNFAALADIEILLTDAGLGAEAVKEIRAGNENLEVILAE